MVRGRSAIVSLRGAAALLVVGLLLGLLAACGGTPPAQPDAGASNAGGGAAAGTPQRGGTMSVAYQNDMATLDPAIGYDWNNWPM